MSVNTRESEIKRPFIYGAAFLVDCESLGIKGNVYFGKGIVVKGNVRMVNEFTRKANIRWSYHHEESLMS